MKRSTVACGILTILLAAGYAHGLQQSHNAIIPGACPWDVTGPAAEVDGQVLDNLLDGEVTYEDDYQACYDVKRRRASLSEFPKCDLNQDGRVKWKEVWQVEDHIGECENLVFGNQHVAVILINYTQDPPMLTLEEVQEGIFDHEYSLARFVEEASNDNASMTGDIVGWYEPVVPLAPDMSSGAYAYCYPRDEDSLALAAGDLDLSLYDGFMVIVQDYSKSCAAGVAAPTITVNVGPGPEQVTAWFARTRSDFYLYTYGGYARVTNSTLAHELVHALGYSSHSGAYVCGAEAMSTAPCDVEGPSFGPWDIMGYNRSQGSHPSAAVKEYFGWLSPAEITTVTQNGLYTIGAAEGFDPSVVKALKIPLPTPIHTGQDNSSGPMIFTHLYVEYRGLSGIDYRFPAQRTFQYLIDGVISTEQIADLHGALIYAVIETVDEEAAPFPWAALLDSRPASGGENLYSPSQELHDAQLPAAHSFFDPNNGIEITTTAAPADGVATGETDIQVEVTFY